MYSKVKKIKVRNFRNLGEVEVSFEESPIIALTGGNESGKTSLIKAFAVGSMNLKERQQKSYIKTGTSGFSIGIELEDGTEIERSKALTYNRIQIKKGGETVYAVDKIDKGEGIPKELEREMGLVIEPETGECLHIRTYEDKLLFVTTPTSTNYKVVYDALKVDNLVRAIRKGTKEVNTLKGDISTGNGSIEVLEREINTLIRYNTSVLERVKSRLKREIGIYKRLEEISLKVKKLEEMDKERVSLREVKGIESIDPAPMIGLKSLVERIREREQQGVLLREISLVLDREPIKEEVYEKFGSLSELLKSKESLKVSSLVYIRELRELPSGVIEKLREVRSKLERQGELEARREGIDEIAKNLSKEIEIGMRELGIKACTCPNCKELIIIE